MDAGAARAGTTGGSLSFWVVEAKWARLALVVASVVYVGALLVLASRGEPVVLMLMAVPILVAGAWFGLKVTVWVILALLVTSALVLEVFGSGVGETLSDQQILPILMLVVVGVVLGRLHDVSVALAKEVQRSRLAERDLRAAEARLEGHLDAKDELIATVGNELRTPLNAVLGFADLLRVGSDGTISEAEREEMVQFIAKEAFDLTGVIDDLLIAARLEADRLETNRVPTSLRSQVAQVLEGWDNEDRPGIEVVGDDVRAIADPAGVRQILRNLITNAVRHGGSQITVTTGSDAQLCFVEVSDNGVGLPMSEWEHIFEPYYRVEAGGAPTNGSGLGLTVSRGLAEKMDGTLTYRYDGQKSRFRLALPPFVTTGG